MMSVEIGDDDELKFIRSISRMLIIDVSYSFTRMLTLCRQRGKRVEKGLFAGKKKECYKGIFINLNDSLDQFCFISRDIVDSSVDRTYV